MLLGDFVLQIPYPVSVLRKIKIYSYQSLDINSCMNVSMLSNHVLKLKCWLQNAPIKRFDRITTLSARRQKASVSGGLSPRPPTMFYISAN